MQNKRADKRTEWTAVEIVAVIGIILLLCLTAYVSSVAIDARARKSSSAELSLDEH